MRLLLIALALAVGNPVSAQKEPKRPKLPAGADTNDARAYMDYGNAWETPWNKAYDAYYWAMAPGT